MDLVVRGHKFFHDVQEILISFTAVDDQGLLQRYSQLQLPLKHLRESKVIAAD